MAPTIHSFKRWVYSLSPLLFLTIVVIAISASVNSISEAHITALQNRVTGLENTVELLDGLLQSITVSDQSVLLPELYKHIASSVVQIENRVAFRGTFISRSLGSGFVYSSDGYVATNYHVVQGASELVVSFLNGNVTQAKVVGLDQYSDLAIIKLDVSYDWLVPLPLGNSSKIQVGETVVAIGSPFGLGSTMTSGIVSQVGRELEITTNYKIVDIIQHDVPINPGNSGGPLLNLMGEVVGINTAIASSTGTYSGIGFAISSNTIARVAFELITKEM